MTIERCDYCKKEDKPYSNDYTTIKAHFDGLIFVADKITDKPPKVIASYCSSCYGLFLSHLREFNKGPKP